MSLLIARIPGQPTLQAAAANEGAARVSVQVAHRSLLPSITVSTSYGQDFMPGSPNWLSVGVNLSLPIFPGDRQDQTIAAAQEQEMAAVDDYDEQRLRIARELRSAYAQYQAADAEYKRGQQDLTLLATQTYSAELNDFRGGRGRFQSVLRAQNTVLTTALETLTARRDRALAIAQLDYLTTQYRGVQP
ncbi:TolC family protein [Acidithiobacillus caldus]|uniref:TolC family protein n=1 Tax=Acidithiobacillus caldus TaxID=33059 RepID=UPI001F3530F7|nr:TolC family protein [Acidithiobacillus caldus]